MLFAKINWLLWKMLLLMIVIGDLFFRAILSNQWHEYLWLFAVDYCETFSIENWLIIIIVHENH